MTVRDCVGGSSAPTHKPVPGVHDLDSWPGTGKPEAAVSRCHETFSVSMRNGRPTSARPVATSHCDHRVWNVKRLKSCATRVPS